MESTKEERSYTSYGEDLKFLKEYVDVVELSASDGDGEVAVSANLQGRVMTSSAEGKNGRSYGWINKELFQSRDTLEHINAFGGEERFWLGPEGGQFSIFFENGATFDLDAWQTPRLIDLDAYEVISKSSQKVTFAKEASLTNYSGFEFQLGIKREVTILSSQEVTEEFGIDNPSEVKSVAYRTTNTLTNKGLEDWKKETGLLSIWLLGMFNPSESTTVVVPFVSGGEETLGEKVNIYESFGEIPDERLIKHEDVAYFSGDGQYRSKIGLSPQRAKDVIGSYDESSKVLTVVKYNKPEGVTDYVNSAWELQDEPYAGDVVNSYNDGPPAPGKKPLGPFYELETSSPALALKAGESGTHMQTTCHFEGSETQLDKISRQVLGVSLQDIMSAFGN